MFILVNSMRFVDRSRELEALGRIWDSDRAELVIVLGRRRVGKTSLILKFAEGKRSLYLYTFHASPGSVLKYFTREISKQLGVIFPPGYALPDWDAFYGFLYELSREDKILVVIDEFQRFSETSPDAIDMLQHWWDKALNKTKIKLVLVGSSIGMIERVALSGSSPLYGRKTSILNVKPMNFFEFREAFSSLEPLKQIEFYSIFGGTPHYFNMIDPNKSVEDNIMEKVASPYAPLRDEPEQLLRTELRSISIYMDILEKIAKNHTASIGDIASSMNKSRSELYPYLLRLEKMDIITRVYRPTEKRAEYRRARFKITDNYIKFWFTYIYPNQGEIERGNTQIVLEEYLKNKEMYVSKTYEEIVNEFLERNSGKEITDALQQRIKLPKIIKTGTWWWKNIEIDVCGIGDKAIILGEVKWKEKGIEKRDIEELITTKTRAFLKKTETNKPIRYLIATKKTPKREIAKKLKEIKAITLIPETII